MHPLNKNISRIDLKAFLFTSSTVFAFDNFIEMKPSQIALNDINCCHAAIKCLADNFAEQGFSIHKNVKY
jgi:hypothetical protein